MTRYPLPRLLSNGDKLDGILNINKPQGKTSFSIVALLKRLSGERRVGHGGTLDPLATGVLPVCLGQGTRVVEFLADSTKTYRAEIELGIATDTYDSTGRITQKGDASVVTLSQLESALASFRGLIPQSPPMYSAVKYHGKPLYELARAGIEVERRSRLARIDDLRLIGWQPPIATIEVVCGKGTYIRSLAHDLGQVLGCGATLKNLVRLKCGPFDISEAISIPQIEDAFRYGFWRRHVYPIDIVLLHWAALIVGEEKERAIKHGRPLTIATEPSSESRCRVYTHDGCFLALLRINPEMQQWQPDKVFLT